MQSGFLDNNKDLMPNYETETEFSIIPTHMLMQIEEMPNESSESSIVAKDFSSRLMRPTEIGI
jgi:hypothetical protein